MKGDEFCKRNNGGKSKVESTKKLRLRRKRGHGQHSSHKGE